MKGLPRDTGGAVILEGLSQSKQKEKQVKKKKKSCRQTARGSISLFWTASKIWQSEKTSNLSRFSWEITSEERQQKFHTDDMDYVTQIWVVYSDWLGREGDLL